MRESLLPPASLARYADAIVRASLGIEKDDTLVVQGEPEHRELLVAVAESAYRAGARFVDVVTVDPLVMRARLLHGSDDALGALSPWSRRRLREASGPHGALVHITGEGEAGYLDGVPPGRIATDYSRLAKQLGFLRRAQLDLRARWIIAGWPTDHWAGQVYPELEPLKAKRRLADDLVRFCRLADDDGKGTSGWTTHLRTLSRRSTRLTKLGLSRLELRSPGTELDVGFVEGTRWLGGFDTLVDGRKLAANMPTEEVFTSPDPRRTTGTFRCTFPLSFRGRRGGGGEDRDRNRLPSQICQAPSRISGIRRPRASKPVASSSGPPIMTSRWIAERFNPRAGVSERVPPKPLPKAMWAAAFSSSRVL